MQKRNSEIRRKIKFSSLAVFINEEFLEMQLVWHSVLLLQQYLRKLIEAAKFLHQV